MVWPPDHMFDTSDIWYYNICIVNTHNFPSVCNIGLIGVLEMFQVFDLLSQALIQKTQYKVNVKRCPWTNRMTFLQAFFKPNMDQSAEKISSEREKRRRKSRMWWKTRTTAASESHRYTLHALWFALVCRLILFYSDGFLP